eukprot:213604-Chlamydomonas_euryale.AAC.10
MTGHGKMDSEVLVAKEHAAMHPCACKAAWLRRRRPQPSPRPRATLPSPLLTRLQSAGPAAAHAGRLGWRQAMTRPPRLTCRRRRVLPAPRTSSNSLCNQRCCHQHAGCHAAPAWRRSKRAKFPTAAAAAPSDWLGHRPSSGAPDTRRDARRTTP